VDEITRTLNAAARGDGAAAERSIGLLYAELRRLAARHLSREFQGSTLQPTALVHEAYVRLFGPGTQSWADRGHFFFAAGQAMRRILVERARARSRLKRGGDRRRVALDPESVSDERDDLELLALDEALQRLEQRAPRQARVVTLRYFAGLTMAEVAEALGVSKRLVENEWTQARAWLLADLGDPADDDHDTD